MMTMPPRLAALTRRLRHDDRGLALIEFAFSLPVLVVLCMSGLECANLALAHMRVSQVAMLVADNAARVRTSIDEADVNEIMTGAELSTKAKSHRPSSPEAIAATVFEKLLLPSL